MPIAIVSVIIWPVIVAIRSVMANTYPETEAVATMMSIAVMTVMTTVSVMAIVAAAMAIVSTVVASVALPPGNRFAAEAEANQRNRKRKRYHYIA